MKQFVKICDINGNKLVENADFPIYGVSDAESPRSNTIIYLKKGIIQDRSIKEAIIIARSRIEIDDSCIQVLSDYPKNEYARILCKLQECIEAAQTEFKDGSYIDKGLRIGKNSIIGKFCVIENNVVIGDNCSIGDYSFIGAHTRIGNNVEIQQRCSIGIADADIYRVGDCCLTLPHLAGTIIEDGCLLLEGAQIAAGDTQPTMLMRGSMLGIAASLGHNSTVGNNTLIGAHACVCGHCRIGGNSYIAPSATVMNRLIIGDNVKAGLGTVVFSNLKSGSKVFGNPAVPTMPFGNKDR